MNILFTRTITLLLFILISTKLFSQRKIEGVVIDASDKSPVQYASISIKNKSVYVDADSTGRFFISAFENDTLSISCIGFNELLISAGSFVINRHVELVPKVKQLPTVYTGKFETKKIGTIKAKVSHSFSANLTVRTEFAKLIKVPAEINLCTISKISFVIRN
ncbi:hypothetical protein ESA94_17860 [Lacibacter luteus]|uniref:Carboxypeptidase-like regulatory domain-containing protein n=1 Tax=Lacibacter luteus TaxID=2508719 RepID=A0A4Q1CFN4_9BACT|nr:carboxypeptidase-like regulatory domain-containing protein [Lacibacter luteus]RXK58503.1 hypothetical protein ESA94_17860 [Lacibacter luteus]